MPGGFSAVIRDLEREKFDIVFFHNVLPHLPSPFLILEKSFNLLNNEGLLFANGVLICEEEWEKIESYLKKNNYQFSFRTKETSSP